jgi:hypothetical protein
LILFSTKGGHSIKGEGSSLSIAGFLPLLEEEESGGIHNTSGLTPKVIVGTRHGVSLLRALANREAQGLTLPFLLAQKKVPVVLFRPYCRYINLPVSNLMRKPKKFTKYSRLVL